MINCQRLLIHSIALFGVTVMLLSSSMDTLEAFTTTTKTPNSGWRYDDMGEIRKVLSHRNIARVPKVAAIKNDDDDERNKVESISTFRVEAQALQTKADEIRREIEGIKSKSRTVPKNDVKNKSRSVDLESVKVEPKVLNHISLPWSVEPTDEIDAEGEDYRLYVDIGREDGTWMDPRWGASGNRIPFALDIKLLTTAVTDDDIKAKMVKDNTMGKTSDVFVLKTAPFARLRDGFDRMQCHGGAYRIDMARNGQYTIRMMVQVEGTKADQNFIYGDVSIPKGCLYFSLPCFGGQINQLSTKEGPVTVRQVGWHTGWRRQESRIVGTFRAATLDDAKRKDSY